MKETYDFLKGVKGKFYIPENEIELPVYLNRKNQEFYLKLARDLFAILKDTAGVSTSWLIECKKYSPENKVGVDIVRALWGIKFRLQVVNAMLATTSYFTAGVHKLKASSYDLELKDYEGILEWINEYHPNPDGKLYIKDHQLKLPGEG